MSILLTETLGTVAFTYLGSLEALAVDIIDLTCRFNSQGAKEDPT